MIIYLIRHGQTTGDVENRYGGDYEDHLTEIGQQQSRQIAEQLEGKKIEQLYTSPRLRALETATIISKKLNVEMMPIDEFRERNTYGVLSGLTRQEAGQKYPNEVAQLEGLNGKVKNSEEYKPFQQRVVDGLNNLATKQAGTLALVTHGGPIRLIFRDVLKMGEINLGDCAYAVLEANNGDYKLLDKSGIEVIT